MRNKVCVADPTNGLARLQYNRASWNGVYAHSFDNRSALDLNRRNPINLSAVKNLHKINCICVWGNSSDVAWEQNDRNINPLSYHLCRLVKNQSLCSNASS